MDIHPTTFLEFIPNVVPDEHGWIHFLIKERPFPRNGLTHGAIPVDETFTGLRIPEHGLVYHLNEFGDIIMSAHVATVTRVLPTVAVNSKGWIKFRVRRFPNNTSLFPFRLIMLRVKNALEFK